MAEKKEDLYAANTAAYNADRTLPIAKLERQYIDLGLGDCTGKTMIDLGGGSGLHARRAVDLGVKLVDLIDLSPSMIEEGKAAGQGRNDPIRWFVGDVTGSLNDLPLEKDYDITLVGWTFDHAENPDQLDRMWQNVAKYTKPGGKLVNMRTANIRSESGQSGKYATKYTDINEIPGGLAYTYHIFCDPPWSCPGTSMNANMNLEESKIIAERHGFSDFKQIPPGDLQVIKDDPEFWKQYLDDPMCVCVTAVKKS